MSTRQERKQERRMKETAKKMTDTIQFTAVDMLNGIKATWSSEEIDFLCNWLKDKDAPAWGQD